MRSGELNEISVIIGELRADVAEAKLQRLHIMDHLDRIELTLKMLAAERQHRKGLLAGLAIGGGLSGAGLWELIQRLLK